NYPLTLTVHGGERLSLHLEYLRAQFDTDTVQHIGTYLQGLLQQFIQAPEQAVGAIPLLLDPEYTRVLQDWNPRSVAQTAKASVLQRFEQQAARHPQNIALILDQQR
ncbi:hypothetical protein NYY90_19735, partial [Acinetobacter baumannii]|nr:hypothetical protein [Acinetobacter baumannii]